MLVIWFGLIFKALYGVHFYVTGMTGISPIKLTRLGAVGPPLSAGDRAISIFLSN